MPQISEEKREAVLKGRKAVDAYRQAHTDLHSKPWHRGIPEEHTPLLNIVVKALKELGFNTIQEFFDASGELNIKESKKSYLRGGECNRCGKCCEQWCKSYSGNGVCAIYENRPQGCIDYPSVIDLLSGRVVKECSYYLREIKKPDIDLRWN